MATVNRTRISDRHKKGKVNVMMTRTGFAELATSADVYELFTLPKNSYVLSANIFVITAANSATSAVADVGFAGGDTLLDGVDLKSAANTLLAGSGNRVVPQWKATGGVVTIKPTYVGADTAGDYLVIVQYIELGQDTGEMTNFSTT